MSRYRFCDWVTWASLVWAVLHAPARSQEFVAETTITHQVVLHNLNTQPGGYATIWTPVGFGRVTLDDAALPRIWKIDEIYTIYRVPIEGTGPMNTHWLTTKANWNQYRAHLPTLQEHSFNLKYFRLNSNYEPPVIVEPVTWENVSDNLTVGHLAETELILVKLIADGWEWTVRGVGAVSAWTHATDKESAKSEAEAAIR